MSVFSRLGRLLGLSPIPADVAEGMAGVQNALESLTQSQSVAQATTAALRETVERLEKQLARAGKEQFKANALAEQAQQSLKSTLEQLREAEAFRERELAHLREKVTSARAEGRLDMIQRLLPALDGLSEALAAGHRLLEGQGDDDGDVRPDASPLPFGQRLIGAWELLTGSVRTSQRANEPTLNPDALAAWLEGLEFVQERLLAALAAEGVHPIETEGETFDPALHVAIEALPASDGVAPGAILSETRRGYLVGDQVLRYAEVVVAR